MLKTAIRLRDGGSQGLLTPRDEKEVANTLRNVKSPETSPNQLEDQNDDDPIVIKKKLHKKKAAARASQMFEPAEEEETGGIEDGAKSKLEFEKLQIADVGVLFSSVVGGTVTVLAYDVQFDEGDDGPLFTLLMIVFASTLLAIVLLILRYVQKLSYLKARRVISRKETLFSSGEIWNLLMEIVMLLFLPYPWLIGIKVTDYIVTSETPFYYYVNDLLSVLVVIRIYLFARVILNYTIYRSPRARRLTAMYGADNDYLYACKCLMRNAPFSCVVITLGVSIFVFGYMLRICERPLSRLEDESMLFSTYWNSMWCVILTMTTVGYGDYYPRTHYGRVVTFLCCIWGVFVVSIMVVTLNNTLSMSPAEEKALTVLQRLELRKALRTQAADVLSGMARIGLNNKNKKESPQKIKAENQKIVQNIKTTLDGFKQNSRQIRALSDTGNISEVMSRQFDFMRDEMKEMRAEQQDLRNAVQRLTEILANKNTVKSVVYKTPLPDILENSQQEHQEYPVSINIASFSKVPECDGQETKDGVSPKSFVSLSKVPEVGVPYRRPLPPGIFDPK